MKGRKARILIIGALPPPAIGPYIAMERILGSQLLNDQFDVVFLDISDRRSIRSMGRLDLVNIWLALRHGCQCLFLLLTRRPAAVYLGISQGIFGYLRDLTFLIPSVLLRKRIVLHLRGSEFGEFYNCMPSWLKRVTRWLLANTAKVIVLGECLRSVFKDLIPSDRISVIPNGIDCTGFSMGGTQTRLDSGVPGRILYLAHLSRRKGILIVLEAFALVLQRFPTARLTVAGQWQAKEEKAEAVTLIQSLGIGDRIEFLGEVTGQHKTEVFLGHDIFVFTPIAPEGLPWVILEAMSARLPIVTTNQGAIREVVVDGCTGCIVSPSADEVADALLWLLEHPEQARAFGMAGHQRVRNHFSEDRYREKLVALFEDVCGLSSPSSVDTRGMLPPAAEGKPNDVRPAEFNGRITRT